MSLGTLPQLTSISIHGLKNALTPTNPLLPLTLIAFATNSSNNKTNSSGNDTSLAFTVPPFADTGAWNGTAGTLTVVCSADLAANEPVSFSFELRNPTRGQEGMLVYVEAAGLIARTWAPSLETEKNSAPLLVAYFVQVRRDCLIY